LAQFRLAIVSARRLGYRRLGALADARSLANIDDKLGFCPVVVSSQCGLRCCRVWVFILGQVDVARRRGPVAGHFRCVGLRKGPASAKSSRWPRRGQVAS
jgi:hypothetical protein